MILLPFFPFPTSLSQLNGRETPPLWMLPALCFKQVTLHVTHIGFRRKKGLMLTGLVKLVLMVAGEVQLRS
jgi:hypothetical protein